MRISEKRIRKIFMDMPAGERNQRLLMEVLNQRADRVRVLLELGADVQSRYSDGWSILHTAACNGDRHMVELLLNYGADPDKRDVNGWNPLYMAVRGGFATVVDMLLQAGSRADMQDEEGWTPLHVAASNGNIEMMKKLIEFGGNPMFKNHMGISAIETLEKCNPAQYASEAEALLKLHTNVSMLKLEDSPSKISQVDFNI